VALLAELGQALLALTFSATVAYWIGPVYAAVALLVAITCGVLLTSVAHEQLRARPVMEQAPNLLRTAGSILLTAVTFGGAWPAIPLIFAWGAWREHDGDRDRA